MECQLLGVIVGLCGVAALVAWGQAGYNAERQRALRRQWPHAVKSAGERWRAFAQANAEHYPEHVLLALWFFREEGRRAFVDRFPIDPSLEGVRSVDPQALDAMRAEIASYPDRPRFKREAG